MKTTLRNCLLLFSIGGLPLNPLFAQDPASLNAEARPSDASPVLEAGAEVVDELAEGEAVSSVETARSVEDNAAVIIAPADDVAIPEAPSDAVIPASETAETRLGESAIDPAGSDPYLDALGAEARAEDRPAPAEPRREQTSGGRVNAIRGIVADALEKPRKQSEPVNTLIAPDSSAPAARSRRDELRSAVSRATRATGSGADLYISTLKKEGDHTRVIDEQASRRPAVVEQVPVQGPAAELRDETADDGRTYRVQAGDSFWRIAERLYGDGYKFLELYEANKDQVTDENLLVVGQVLRVPALDESAVPQAFGN